MVFTVKYEEDGVFLEIDAESITRLNKDALIQHLKRKAIHAIDNDSLKNIMESGGYMRIAPPQIEKTYGEDLIVEVTGDNSKAFIRLLAPEFNGPYLKPDYVTKKLSDAGVVYGIDKEALTWIINSRDYSKPHLVARATPKQDGEDGKLIFHFSTDKKTGFPIVISGGRVDLRTLDLFVPVSKDQLLVSRTGATKGKPGTSVRGHVINQTPGKEVALPRGKNVRYDNNRNNMYASCSGLVDYVNKSINVSNVYIISGDCDTSVGNIDFNGSVLVTGSVRSGYTIKATDGINVGGSVESAQLIAGGNVEVKGGMHGSGRGSIEAGGSVSIRFVEQGAIVADGSVNVDVSMHSRIETGGSLHAVGRRGAIIGGQVAVAGDVVANYLGALSHTKTEVAVGAMPRKRIRLSVIEKELDRLAAEIVKLDQLDRYLEKTKNTLNNEMWTSLHNSSAANRQANIEETKSYIEESTELSYEMEHATSSKVHVFETAYSGSRIVIGSNAIKLNDEISYSTFKVNEGEVVYGPCEKSKADVK